MNCPAICEDTSYTHQNSYLHPATHTHWEELQKSMFGILQVDEKELVLSGDGRCDSQGYSAKYCTYSFMEVHHNVILDD